MIRVFRARPAGLSDCHSQGGRKTVFHIHSSISTLKRDFFCPRSHSFLSDKRRCFRFRNSTSSGESSEEAFARRLRESQDVEDRVQFVETIEEFETQLDKAGQKLLVLEISSDEVCQTGTGEDPEYYWEEDKKASLEPCITLKHVFQRCARNCPDTVFVAALDNETDNSRKLMDYLEVRYTPSLFFYRAGKRVWKVEGVNDAANDLGEGVLFYGDKLVQSSHPTSEWVPTISSKDQLQQFLVEQPPNLLAVVDVSTSDCNPCVHVFPAVVALARSLEGHVKFARFLCDSNSAETFRELGVVEVPTFIFYRGGTEVLRYVGSSRGDLIGKILEVQAAAGIQPPPPPPARGWRARRSG